MRQLVENYDVDEIRVYEPSLSDIFVEYAGKQGRKDRIMKQFLIILKFELQHYFKNKIFAGITIFLVLAIGAVMFFPRVSGLFKHESESPERGERDVMLVSAEGLEEIEIIGQVFGAAFEDYDVKATTEGVEAIKEQVLSGEAECAFVLTGDVSYTYYVNNLSMYDANTSIADEILQNVYRMNAMIEGGITPQEAGNILSVQIEHKVESLGKDQMQNFFYTYIMIFALWSDGGNQCGDRKEFQSHGSAHYQCETFKHDVWKGHWFGAGRSDPVGSGFRRFRTVL